VYFSADKNYTLLQLNNGQKLVFTFSLQKMEQYLSEKLKDDAKVFARIGKSYIINLSYVYQIDIIKQKVKLFVIPVQKEFSLPVSKEALKNLRKLFIN
jgi:DNA-binding LytR/AlgR family response regulator